MDYLQYKNYLAHHGVEGQKWGVRRYQNEDGTLTALGRQHLGIGDEESNKLRNQVQSQYYNKRGRIKYGSREELSEAKRKYISERQNKITTNLKDAFSDPEDNRDKRAWERQDKLYNASRAEIKKSADMIFGSDDQIKSSKFGEIATKALIAAGMSTLALGGLGTYEYIKHR